MTLAVAEALNPNTPNQSSIAALGHAYYCLSAIIHYTESGCDISQLYEAFPHDLPFQNTFVYGFSLTANGLKWHGRWDIDR